VVECFFYHIGSHLCCYLPHQFFSFFFTTIRFYKTAAIEFSRVQVSVDTYLFSGQYTDLATLSVLSKYTSGSTYYYPAFLAQRDSKFAFLSLLECSVIFFMFRCKSASMKIIKNCIGIHNLCSVSFSSFSHLSFSF